MTVRDFAGLAGGLAGAALFAAGVLVALLAGLRLALAYRRPPERTRFARGTAAGASVTAALGAVLFWASELLPQRRAVDRGAAWLALGAIAIGIWTGARFARRGRVAPAGAGDAPSRPADPG